MEARAREVDRIFDQTITYLVPLYQRPYVWKLDLHWEPLWEDVQNLLDRHLASGKVHPHFLGAVVLERLPNSTGGNQVRQVIDGQQRFTTLQLLLTGARDVSAGLGADKFVNRFGDYVANRRDRIDHDDEVFKLWPTNSDRAAYRLVHEAGSPAKLDEALQEVQGTLTSLQVIDAYRYFHGQIDAWITGKLDDDVSPAVAAKTTLDRLDTLWHVLGSALQLVVIDLDAQDETQVIFETLNARGEELLPADLIKNFLFRASTVEKDDVDALYEKHWRMFETAFWREHVKQGRITRPRIDVFINYYLAMASREEVRSSHLFNAFKAYVQKASDQTPSVPAAEHIRALAKYGKIFAGFEQPKDHPRLTTFLRRLRALDTTTPMPFLLHAYNALVPARRADFDRVVGIVETYLSRRQIVNLTSKNYNKFFIDLIDQSEVAGTFSVSAVIAALLKGEGDSVRFPSDNEVRRVLREDRLYGRLAQYKVRFILEALDAHAFTSKSEMQVLPDDLTIEHVLPQKWTDHWPLPEPSPAWSPAEIPVKQAAVKANRDRTLQTLGNLTLITGSLNPSLSNGPWLDKRPELLKFSKLNLTQYFHQPECAIWNEAAIEKRGGLLAEQILEIWPNLSSA